MRPLIMKFRQGKGEYARDVYVNMNQVCCIAPGETGSILTFAAIVGDEAAYICVNETPDQIGLRPEWHR